MVVSASEVVLEYEKGATMSMAVEEAVGVMFTALDAARLDWPEVTLRHRLTSRHHSYYNYYYYYYCYRIHLSKGHVGTQR